MDKKKEKNEIDYDVVAQIKNGLKDLKKGKVIKC